MPTVTVAESTSRENVTIDDDVVLSSTQLSNSIDIHGDSHRRRSTFTSVSTFPCCQVRLKAHGNSTFPLFFENNQLVDHFESISMHDLLKHIMKRIKDEGNINNEMRLLMAKEFVRDQRRIEGNQGVTTNIRHNFPVHSKLSKSLKFPCSSFDNQQRFGGVNGLPADTEIISQGCAKTKAEQLQQDATTFPIKTTGINTTFPLQDKDQPSTICFKRLNINLISKSLQDMIPKSYTNLPKKPNANAKFDLNEVIKTLELTQNLRIENCNKPQVHLGMNLKFPLKVNLNIGNHQRRQLNEGAPKFPSIQIFSTNLNVHKPQAKQFSLNIYDSQLKPAQVVAFPLKLRQNFAKFPIERSSKELIHILSAPEVMKRFSSNKILISLQTTHNFQNCKSFTKFPLKDRLVKKFCRIFPSEKDIPITHGPIAVQKHKISTHQQQQHFTNFPNDNATSRNNVNIFKIITTAEAEALMTPDLYKHHWSFCQQRNTAVDDHEKHASQVQFTQQVHVENPVGTPPTIPRPSQTQETPSTHNEDDKNLNISPAIDAKNISLTTTKTATEVGQYSENFEHHDAIINIRDDDEDASLSSGATLSRNIINSSFNHGHYNEVEHKHERERVRNVGGILRASTPPMSAITSVQNTERLVVVLHDHDMGGGDLCNPQVAQIVECSSDVRDTFNTTVDNGGRTKLNFSITGNILDKNQTESSAPPPQIQEPSSLPPLRSHSSSPPRVTAPNVAAVASISDRICSTSLAENYTSSSEILPKYSVLELSESNAINCPEIDCTAIKDVIDQYTRQSSEKERAAAVSHEIIDAQVEATNINDIFNYYTNDEQHTLDNSEIDEIYDLEFDLNDLIEVDEMKFEMKSSKGALPSTTSANARNVGKTSETAVSSFQRSKPYATTTALRGPSVHVSPTVPASSVTRPTATQRSENDHSSLSGLRNVSDRIASTAPTNSISRPTATRRLSSDYNSVPASSTYSASPRPISNIPTNSASQRTSSSLTTPRSSLTLNYGGESTKILPATPATNRYTNENTAAATPTAATKLKYTRRPTSGALLSLDLPRYTSSSESLTDSPATINRGVSLDTTSVLDVLPERTRLRRQRRFRPQDSQDEDEDAIERLNRLKARISASLSEVKGVLKQYSTEGEGENETQNTNALTPTAVSSPTLGKVKEDIAAEKNEEEGPVTFRFVKKIRRRSFFIEDDDTELNTGKDEVDKSQSVSNLQTEECSLKLPQGADVISQDDVKPPEYKSQSDSNNFGSASAKLSSTRFIKVEDKNDVQSQDIGPSGYLVPQNTAPEFNKRPSVDVQRQDEQHAEIKTNDREDDVNVNKSKTGNTESRVLPKPEMTVHNKVNEKTEKVTKKGQNIKVKANKNGSQQREVKSGKSASKIPQRIETKPAINVTNQKMETKTNTSDTTAQNNDNSNETKRIEISKIENVKEISAKPSAEEIKKTHTVQGPKGVAPTLEEPSKQAVVLNNISFEEIPPKAVVNDIKMQENKRKEINAKNILSQKENQLEIKEKEETKKDKKESSPKPTKQITTAEIGRTKDVSPKPKVSEVKGNDTENKPETRIGMENHQNVSPQTTMSIAGPLKPLIKVDLTEIHEPKDIDKKQIQTADRDLSEKATNNDGPVKLRQKVPHRTKDSLRRASLAAVEGSKIEPPLKIAMPAKIERRPSDSEAIVKKKLITTKTTTSGCIEEVTPKPKIVKIKRSSIRKPTPPLANSNDTRHQLAATQGETISANNRNGQRIKDAASLTSTETNKSIQGDKNKDVTMPNDEMLTQMPPQPPANDTKSLVGQINRTQLNFNEAATNYTPSPSLTRKTIELDASSSQATIENAKATTTNLAASKFENSDGGAMLANSKPILVSATTATAAIGPKQTTPIPPQEDLHDLLQQEAVVLIKPTKKDPNELKAEENNKQIGPHKNLPANNATPANLEASAKQLIEPLEIPQQQVVNTTDIIGIKSNDDSLQVIATPPQQSSTAKDSTNLASTAASSSVDQHTTSSVKRNQQTQQQQHSPTTITTTIEDATTKTNDSPQISISSQVATTEDTHSKSATQTTSIQEAALQVVSKGLEGDLGKMPEFQLTPAPVQTAEIPHEPHKTNAVITKIVRHNSGQNAKKADEKVVAIEESVIPEISLDTPNDEPATASSGEDLSEATELSTEESSSQSEPVAAAAKPKKVRKAKKKVIIKRQKRRLSVCGDTFFNHNSTDEIAIAEVETLEKPISFVSDEDEPEDEPVVKEQKPLKSCISKKEYEIGDEILYGERIKKTQIKWRRGRVKQCTSSISYLLDIDGKEVSSHVCNLKKFTNRKVNFGTKEYLEIDYEQLAEDEERAERVKQRTFSIWNMV